MSINRSRAVGVTSIALGFMVAAGSILAQEPSHVVVPADKVQWGPAPPALPAGAEIAVLEGNPSEKGPATVRLRLPANYAVPPHWHNTAERVTVLSGTFNVGMGDRLDRNASQRLEPGGFVSLPAKMHHFAWASTPAVVQISLEGPFDIFYVNASDDPRKTSTR